MHWSSKISPALLWPVCLLAFLPACRKPSESPAAGPKSTPTIAPWFEEVTARVGLNFIHETGPTGRYLVPEQMGSGAALFDFDNDGRLDIYLVQNGGRVSRSPNRLFHQEADGRFKDVGSGSGLDVTGPGMGAAIGDVSNDGQADVLLTEYGAVRLFLNQGGGRFVDITSSCGLDNPRWATSASFFDYDRDGWLDLVVGNYLDYDPTQQCTDAKGAPEFCGPHGFSGLVTRLFRNIGSSSGPRFEDVTVASGLALSPGPALGVFCADFDGDRWPDIFVTDDGKPNRLFINQRHGTFTEQAVARGVAFNAMGQTAGNMGIAFGDVDGNGLFDLFVTHLAEEYHALWSQQPRGLFQDRMAVAGLTRQGWRGTGFGAVLADFDHDGAPDLAFVNGLVKRGRDRPALAPGVSPFWAPYAQQSQVFANDGQGNFRDLSPANPAFCGQAIVGRGLACGDLDNDGAVDLLTTSSGGPAQLFRNIAPDRGHWLVVRAIDPALGGRDAYGAEVIVEAAGRRWWRLVNPAFSYLSSSDPRVHVGLGAASSFDSIQVLWPDSSGETFAGGPANRLLVLRKGTGRKSEP